MRVIVVSGDTSSGLSFYRYGCPFIYLERQYPNIKVDVVNTLNKDWSVLMKYDVLFLHQPFSPQSLELIEIAKSYNLKVWIDCDDLVSDVSSDNPAKLTFNETSIMYWEYCLQACDFISVSTKELKEQLSIYNINIGVVPNGFPLDVVPVKPKKATHNFITWRGSSSHYRDLIFYKDLFKTLSETKYVLNFVGQYPFMFHDILTDEKLFNFNHYGWRSMMESIQMLQNLNSKFHIIPLYNSIFNRCKSNIAWIEATLSGSVCIAPTWWEVPKIDISKQTNEIIFELDVVNDIWEQSIQMVNDKYDLVKLNSKRNEILAYI